MENSYKNIDPPAVLAKLIDLIQHSDDELSWEASLALKFYFERECISGNAAWLSDVESFLVFQDNLVRETGVVSIKEIRICPETRNNLARCVFQHIENGVANAWRYAFVLKRATCVPGLQDMAAEYLGKNWRRDEAVTLHLLVMIWAGERAPNFIETLEEICEHAKSKELRDDAEQDLRIMRELEFARAEQTDE